MSLMLIILLRLGMHRAKQRLFVEWTPLGSNLLLHWLPECVLATHTAAHNSLHTSV